MKQSGKPFTPDDYDGIMPPNTFTPPGLQTAPSSVHPAYDSQGEWGKAEIDQGSWGDARWLDADQHDMVQREGAEVWKPMEAAFQQQQQALQQQQQQQRGGEYSQQPHQQQQQQQVQADQQQQQLQQGAGQHWQRPLQEEEQQLPSQQPNPVQMSSEQQQHMHHEQQQNIPQKQPHDEPAAVYDMVVEPADQAMHSDVEAQPANAHDPALMAHEADTTNAEQPERVTVEQQTQQGHDVSEGMPRGMTDVESQQHDAFDHHTTPERHHQQQQQQEPSEDDGSSAPAEQQQQETPHVLDVSGVQGVPDVLDVQGVPDVSDVAEAPRHQQCTAPGECDATDFLSLDNIQSDDIITDPSSVPATPVGDMAQRADSLLQQEQPDEVQDTHVQHAGVAEELQAVPASPSGGQPTAAPSGVWGGIRADEGGDYEAEQLDASTVGETHQQHQDVEAPVAGSLPDTPANSVEGHKVGVQQHREAAADMVDKEAHHTTEHACMPAAEQHATEPAEHGNQHAVHPDNAQQGFEHAAPLEHSDMTEPEQLAPSQLQPDAAGVAAGVLTDMHGLELQQAGSRDQQVEGADSQQQGEQQAAIITITHESMPEVVQHANRHQDGVAADEGVQWFELPMDPPPEYTVQASPAPAPAEQPQPPPPLSPQQHHAHQQAMLAGDDETHVEPDQSQPTAVAQGQSQQSSGQQEHQHQGAADASGPRVKGETRSANDITPEVAHSAAAAAAPPGVTDETVDQPQSIDSSVASAERSDLEPPAQPSVSGKENEQLLNTAAGHQHGKLHEQTQPAAQQQSVQQPDKQDLKDQAIQQHKQEAASREVLAAVATLEAAGVMLMEELNGLSEDQRKIREGLQQRKQRAAAILQKKLGQQPVAGTGGLSKQ